MEKMDMKKINAEPVIRFLVMSLVVIAFGRYIFQKYHIDFDLLTELTSEIRFMADMAAIRSTIASNPAGILGPFW